MICRNTVVRERPRHVVTNRRLLSRVSIFLGLGLAWVSAARASTYRVFTNTAASSMTLNAGDGVCSLAEAVQHANGNATYNCTDFDPNSGEQRIELLESANKPFSTNHFKVTSLTLQRQGIRIHIFGAGGFIDSTAPNSAFLIPFKSIAFFERVTLTNTAGSAGGRLVENYGELQLYGVTITKGDVTGSQNPSGRGGGIFNGNTQGLFPAVISFAENSVITGNKAKKGGGIYNDGGNINELAVIISNNAASAGGGIYNVSKDPPANGGFASGSIQTFSATIQGNSARAGGGIFNRGGIVLRSSSITGNSTTSTGSSGETSCVGSTNCDGLGGGVVSAHLTNASDTMFDFNGCNLSNNTASLRGGGIYSAGVLQLGSDTINNNRAQDGAAIYVAAPGDGTQFYCEVNIDPNYGPPATIDGNSVTMTSSPVYAIVSGNPGGSTSVGACIFNGVTATGNVTGTVMNQHPFCNPTALRSGSQCPQ